MENDINCQVAKTLNKGIQYFLDNEKFTHFTWISDDNEYYPNFLNDLVLNNTYFNNSEGGIEGQKTKFKYLSNSNYNSLTNSLKSLEISSNETLYLKERKFKNCTNFSIDLFKSHFFRNCSK